MTDAGSVLRQASRWRGPTGVIRRHDMASFYILACALSWGWWLPIAASGATVRQGDPWPTHFPGLLGPLLATFVVTAAADGRAGLRDLARRMVRWRGGWRTTLLAFSPLVVLPIAVAVASVVDGVGPQWTDFLLISGLSPFAPTFIVLLLVVNGFGEETGWRGFAQHRLQARHGQVRAALLVTAGWAVWHLPLFLILESYREFSPLVLPGFVLGLVAGAIVLAFVYNAGGASVAAAACWHATYNIGAGTAAAEGSTAAIITTAVMVYAVVLLAVAARARRRGRPSPAP